MAWTVETIEKDWLGAPITVLALDAAIIVAAFNRADQMLGLPWLEQGHVHDGNLVRGTAPTLRVVGMGQRLAALDGVAGAEKLIQKIRNGNNSADAELTAIYIVRDKPQVQVELEPAVGQRLADFRLREENGNWVYVEVTFPDWSKATERVQNILQRLASTVGQVNKQFALEIFLRREPSETETHKILEMIPTFCNREGSPREDLANDLGFLLLNNTQPGQVVLNDYGEKACPRIGAARMIHGPNDLHRHVAVRLAYSDQRAEQFLDSEAGQLPEDAPGLVMIGTSRAPSGIRAWERLYTKQFELKLHTQVSGICLFSGGMLPSLHGEVWLPQTKLILNSHARHVVPEWICRNITAAGEEFERLSKG
jgi:hypothetical protein